MPGRCSRSYDDAGTLEVDDPDPFRDQPRVVSRAEVVARRDRLKVTVDFINERLRELPKATRHRRTSLLNEITTALNFAHLEVSELHRAQAVAERVTKQRRDNIEERWAW